MASINDPISSLKGVGPSTVKAFSRIGIFTIEDLVLTLPYRVEDRTRIVPIKSIKPNDFCVIRVTVKSVSARKSKRGVLIIQANTEDESGKLPALWFNQRYLLRSLIAGRSYFFYGEKKLMKALGNPFFVKSIISSPEVVPFYHTVSGVSQMMWQRVLGQARECIKELESSLPQKYSYQQLTKESVVAQAHFACTEGNIELATNFLGWEELVILALSLTAISKQKEKKALAITPDISFIKRVVDSLPFQLTEGQRKTSWQIINSFAKTKVSRHILYGEVGSGKTAVAIIVAACVAAAHRQVVFLCPTLILASQQFGLLKNIFEPLGLTVAIATGDQKDKDYEQADIVVGTHALLSSVANYSNHGLVIVDEQHRFGVTQRQLLAENGAHLLMMTATPIPRTLAQVLFGQVEISYLLDKPKHQKPIKTYVFNEEKRGVVEKDIYQRLKNKEQGYVVCPLIIANPSSLLQTVLNDEQKTIENEAVRLHKVFPEFKIGILHGKLKGVEKDKIFQEFKAGKIDILLATTVVEVGVDNQNATWILIEQADCFGLSTLHQLRGRVGRGEKASVCYLADSQTSEFGKKRLEIISQNDNGLELAKHDLSLRGPGELLGYEQSGLPNLRYGSWRDLDKIKEAFVVAQKIVDDGLSKYPELNKIVKKQLKDSTFG